MPPSLQDLTIGAFVRRLADKLGPKTALQYLPDGRSFSYGEVDRESTRCAAALHSIGVRRHSHVALVLENSPEFLFLLIGLARLGAVAVPLSTTLQGRLLSEFLRRADAEFLVSEAGMPALQEPHLLSAAGVRRLVIVGMAQARPPLAGSSLSVARLEDLLDAEVRHEEGEVLYSDLAMLMYTSGTTGPSKANMFTHAHVLQYAMEQARGYGYDADDVVYTCLPISHANGLLSSTYGGFAAHATVALARKFSVSRFWHEVRRSNATVVGLLGSMTDFLWKVPRAADDLANPLRTVIMIPVPHYGPAFAQRFGISIISSYGLTDYALATVYRPDDPAAKLGSAGRPRPGMQVRVVDEHDLDLPVGTAGEILLRSDNMWATSSGYYKMPSETLAAVRNLWFHTGDLGYLDAEGYLYFTDRKKDAIRRRGENVSAFEVEKTLLDHELVKEAAVFAVRSDQCEDEIAACVVLHEGVDLAPQALAEHCAANLASFMTPRYLRFMGELPMTHNNKVEKHKLRADAATNLAAYWDRQEHGPAETRPRERPTMDREDSPSLRGDIT